MNHPNEISIKISFPDAGSEVSQSAVGAASGTDTSPSPPAASGAENTLGSLDTQPTPPGADKSNDNNAATSSGNDFAPPPADNQNDRNNSSAGAEPPESESGQESDQMPIDMPPPAD